MLTVQKGDINGILRRLKACQTWPVTKEVADGSVEAVNEAKQLLSKMHFDEHISIFLNKVKQNTATLLDLTPEVRGWLEEENMMGRIFLKIQV